MKWLSLLLCICLLIMLPSSSSDATAADYETTLINSFETELNETTEYGNWTSSVWDLHTNATAFVEQSSLEQSHGLYSARLNVSITLQGVFAYARLNFTSNESLGTFIFDRLGFAYKLACSNESTYPVSVSFWQYNGSVLIDRESRELTSGPWRTVSIEPLWCSNTTHFVLWFEIFKQTTTDDPFYADLYIDNFRVETENCEVRVRFWNLYTGLGYYTEKLLAKYYSLEDGWVDIWQGAFEATKGDEVLLSVTDAFGRNVWTGTVQVDRDPKYVDIMVPIVTVHITQPDWYNESVPLEWRVTNLPWGSDGPTGTTLPAIGFEFEVLAGWYNLAWLENEVVSAGNQTFLIEGNATEHQGTMMLSDLSIPIDPDYEILIEGDDRKYDLSKADDLIAMLAALYDDVRVKAALLISAMTGIALTLWRLNKKAAAQVELKRGRG